MPNNIENRSITNLETVTNVALVRVSGGAQPSILDDCQAENLIRMRFAKPLLSLEELRACDEKRRNAKT